MGKSGITITFLRIIPIGYIRYVDIKEVQKVTLRDIILHQDELGLNFATKLGNKFNSDRVIIRRKCGIFSRPILITPDNPDKFVELVKNKMVE